MTVPMTKATYRRLMRGRLSPETEAAALRNEWIALAALRLLVARGVVG